MDGLIGCNTTNLPNAQILNTKNLINIVDIFGRKSQRLKNLLLIYIYDDGTTEKKIIIVKINPPMSSFIEPLISNLFS